MVHIITSFLNNLLPYYQSSQVSISCFTMRYNRLISLVGAHCGGEMGDVIVGGVLDVPGKTMYDKLVHFRDRRDDLRQLLLNKPRGRPQRNVNLLLPACDP